MEKLTQETVNFTEKNIDRIAALFPSAITETKDADGKLKRAVNFDQLKQLLSEEVVDGEECYEFTWVGKKQSIIEGNRPIRKTLRPSKEESKNWDSTENLYIEGDNLDVLKLLQNSYLNKVKMIYIDPPYNTGNDFIYRDNFKVSKEDYEEELGLFDEEENRLFKNTETNGRYHSDWCSMMYPRLQLARNLLTDDGVIFISIDDNEVHNLRKICDEVFGEENFVSQLIWERAYSPKNDAKYISNSHDYVIMYAKTIAQYKIGRLPRTDEANARYQNPDNDPRGVWKPSDMSVKTYNEECDYPITTPTGRVIEPPTGRCWSLSKKAFLERLQDNRIYFGSDGNSVPCIKRFLTELKFDGMAPQSIMFYKDVGHSQEGAQEVTKLIETGAFDGPKPVRLLRRLLTLANTEKDSIILDFFSGSATTAHAVMQLNADAEDGGNRKFIMVQLPEETDSKSEAYKAGYKNICEIGKERIRRAGKKIEEKLNAKSKEGELFKEEDRKTPDTGFRVLKVDSTNMKDVYYSPSQYNQQMLLELESNIKEDRTDIDLLYGVLLDWGVPLSLPHITEKIGGKNVHFVNDTDLVACFEEQVPEEVIREIARRKPLRVVFRDSSFRNSPDKINVTEIFKTLSPETTIKVI
ncbi:MAG: site-specific DNA-methyltransferase [Petrimonas sp.]|jgi:adenine-specific DNA-methyltransferase|uniref:site-specific DNA-methyltransferase n=1 Tax=Petrimonas sp. TaxID=2023866 RepID=UPI002B3897D3|nr:site-specific DNA-methyltransferase [Petrimonas sp.]